MKLPRVVTLSQGICSDFTAPDCLSTGLWFTEMSTTGLPIFARLYLHHNIQRVSASMMIFHKDYDLTTDDLGISEMHWAQ
jgi:hypothetical protein